MPYIGKDNVCKTSCSEEDGIYYYLKEEVNIPPLNYKIYKCVDGCNYDDYNYKLVNNSKQCFKECIDNYPYLSSEENLCYDRCFKSANNKFTLEKQDTDGSTIKICTTGCDDTTKIKYSKSNYICKDKCGTEEYLNQETNECLNTCNDYIDLLLDSNSDLTGEKACVASCENIGKYYYLSNKQCLKACQNNDKVVDGLNMCVNNCNEVKNLLESDNNYYLLKDNSFTYTGTSTIYDKCVTSCTSAKPYIDNGSVSNSVQMLEDISFKVIFILKKNV